MSKDITYCSHPTCSNKECEGNVAHFNWASNDEVSTLRSFAAFTECEYFHISEESEKVIGKTVKLVVEIPETWLLNIIASKDLLDKDDEAYLIANGKPYEERLQGEWIKNEQTFFTCNKCQWVNDMNRIKYPFCPNCGVKMKGGAE